MEQTVTKTEFLASFQECTKSVIKGPLPFGPWMWKMKLCVKMTNWEKSLWLVFLRMRAFEKEPKCHLWKSA